MSHPVSGRQTAPHLRGSNNAQWSRRALSNIPLPAARDFASESCRPIPVNPTRSETVTPTCVYSCTWMGYNRFLIRRSHGVLFLFFVEGGRKLLLLFNWRGITALDRSGKFYGLNWNSELSGSDHRYPQPRKCFTNGSNPNRMNRNAITLNLELQNPHRCRPKTSEIIQWLSNGHEQLSLQLQADKILLSQERDEWDLLNLSGPSVFQTNLHSVSIAQNTSKHSTTIYLPVSLSHSDHNPRVQHTHVQSSHLSQTALGNDPKSKQNSTRRSTGHCDAAGEEKEKRRSWGSVMKPCKLLIARRQKQKHGTVTQRWTHAAV